MFPFNKVLVSAWLHYTLTTQTTNQAFTGVGVKPEMKVTHPWGNRMITRLQWCTRDALGSNGAQGMQLPSRWELNSALCFGFWSEDQMDCKHCSLLCLILMKAHLLVVHGHADGWMGFEWRRCGETVAFPTYLNHIGLSFQMNPEELGIKSQTALA